VALRITLREHIAIRCRVRQ